MTTLPIETRAIDADHAARLARTPRAASEQQAEKLEAEAEANEAQADADREKADAARMKEGSDTRRSGIGHGGKKHHSDWSRLGDGTWGLYRDDRKMAMVTGKRGWYTLTIDREHVGSFGSLEKAFAAGEADAAQMREAAGGLYGYTKGTQSDVEATIRKAQRRAASVAKTLYAKDQRTFAFLESHAKRANSKTARLILSAMKSIGPRVAGLHANGARNSLYLDKIDVRKRKDILEAIADHYGTSDMDILTEVTDPDAEPLYEYLAFDRGMAMKVYRDFQSGRFASTKRSSLGIEAVKPNLFYISTSDGDTYGPFRRMPEAEDVIGDLMDLDDTFEAVAEKGTEVLRTILNPHMFQLHTPADLKRQYRTAALLPVEKAAAGDFGDHAQGRIAGGLYGHPTKTARAALAACSDLRAYIGEISFGLHSRRAAKHDRITGFLTTHSRSARCPYSRMILSSYPAAPSAKYAAMPSQSVGAFVAKVDSARSDAGLSMSDEDENEEMLKSAAVSITDQQYDALRPGNRVYMDLSTGYGSTGGEREFVVGRTTYSKKYDVYSKTLYPVDEEGNPIKRGRAKYTLFKRKSGVSLGHGGMGTVIKSFRTASAPDQMLRKAFVPDSVDGWLEWADGTRTARGPKEIHKVRDMEKLVGPLKLESEGEENLYFTDGDGQRWFFKSDGRDRDAKKIRRYLTATTRRRA